MLLGTLLILSLIIFAIFYSFCAGLTQAWIHIFLIETKTGYSSEHDHRMCVYASLFWPIPALTLGVIYLGRCLRYFYNIPYSTYLEVQKRRKKFVEKK